MIEIIPVGGFSEIGRNCVIIKYKNESIMLDLGVHMEHYVRVTQDEDMSFNPPTSLLIAEQAVPDLMSIKDELKQVKAICVSHAHLDHVGAIPFFTKELSVPIYATAFTCEVLKAILKDKRKSYKGKIVRKSENSNFKVSDNLTVEFLNITHSTPQSVVIAVHTPDGTVVYANDFKLDDTPILGKAPNYEGLKNLKNVKALIMNSLYAPTLGRAPSEARAKKLLEELLLSINTSDRNIVITTFSSQIARIKTIVEIARKLKRKPVFIGRSLSKYLDAAKKAGIANFENEADFVRFGGKVENYFKKVKDTHKKLFVVTGHQGEPKAVLSRMATQKIFPFDYEDLVLFCCKIIPNEENYRNRSALEAKLKSKKVRIFSDIHVSGHACREDHREFIKLLKPLNIIPTHGEVPMLEAQKELAREIGYDDKKVHILKNFSRIYL